jgi:hypothetical protein
MATNAVASMKARRLKPYIISPDRKRIEIIDEHGKSAAWIAEAPTASLRRGYDDKPNEPGS